MTDFSPALTPEEWKAALRFPPGVAFGFEEESGVMDRHKLAAICLHGQPFGFDYSGDDLNVPAGTIVQALIETAEAIDTACGPKMIGVVHVKGPSADVLLPAHFASQFRALADRIQALLPPQP